MAAPPRLPIKAPFCVWFHEWQPVVTDTKRLPTKTRKSEFARFEFEYSLSITIPGPTTVGLFVPLTLFIGNSQP